MLMTKLKFTAAAAVVVSALYMGAGTAVQWALADSNPKGAWAASDGFAQDPDKVDPRTTLKQLELAAEQLRKATELMQKTVEALHKAQQPGTSEAPAQGQGPAFTKVGVVDMGVIYAKYKRVNVFKAEMEREAKPFKNKKEMLEILIADWTAALKDPNPKKLTAEDRELGQRILLESRRQLEDLELEFKQKIGKKLEEGLVSLNKEIQNRIKQYATSHGYHLILAYGEPQQPLQEIVDIQRKLKLIDQGGITIAHAVPSIDITSKIVQSLNRRE